MNDDFEELPKMAGWHETNLTVPTGQHLSIANLKPNYNLTFHNNRDTGGLGKQVGKLDFNGPQLVFEGDAEESAKVFIDWIAKSFKGRLDEEYKRGYEDAKQNKEPQR
jgi:hypothetical protein